MGWIIVCCLLLFSCIVLVIYLLALKREMRAIEKELARTENPSYNRQLSVSLFDRDLTALAVQFNHNLDHQKQLKNQAKQSELALRRSISDIAHDLRTPLTVIRGNLQMLEQEGGLSGKSKERLSICRKQATELGRTVDDFFEMSVLESDTEPAALQKIDITTLLVQFLVDHEAYIREHGLTPDISIPEKSLFIPANERMLLRVLENLLGNVAKYAEDTFRIALEQTGDDCCRIVFSNRITADHAVPEDTSLLFTRTYRGSRARSGKGAGLGLYIVKLLSEKQGAKAYAQQSAGRLEIGVLFPLYASPSVRA